MNRLFAIAVAVVFVAAPAVRADDLAAGNWKVTILSFNGANAVSRLLKVETTDGKTTATLVSDPAFKQAALKSFTVKGDRVRAVFAAGLGEQVFEGRIAEGGKKVMGTYGTDEAPSPAWMTPTEVKELDKASAVEPAGEAGAGVTALFKLRTAKVASTPEADLAEWAETASKDAVQYGPAWVFKANLDIATALLKHKGQGSLALRHAQLTEKALEPTAPAARQIKVLETVAQAAQAAGKAEIVKGAMAKVAKFDAELDKEYIAQGLPFKPTTFEGRKKDSKRVVVLELFTGAQCPPCVAADLAFDGLLKTYKPSELAVIQYHEHIPGPDPLTNTESEARWKHYIGAFSTVGTKLGGVPTAIVNGNKERIGGGPIAFAGKTYDAYRNMIDPLLDTPAACEIKATVKRNGEKIDIQADVAGLEKPGADVKLRMVLVEEVIHYGGGNKIRMHHHVVRAMPGGVDGKAMMAKEGQLTATVNLNDLRGTFTKYLDDFVTLRGPFPRAIRPMEMRNLRVIAFVQDDETREILNAVQVDVAEK